MTASNIRRGWLCCSNAFFSRRFYSRVKPRQGRKAGATLKKSRSKNTHPHKHTFPYIERQDLATGSTTEGKRASEEELHFQRSVPPGSFYASLGNAAQRKRVITGSRTQPFRMRRPPRPPPSETLPLPQRVDSHTAKHANAVEMKHRTGKKHP